jgi:hypothetical protein
LQFAISAWLPTNALHSPVQTDPQGNQTLLRRTHRLRHAWSLEGATCTASQNLLAATCKKADWHLVPQLATRIRGKQVRPDGTLAKIPPEVFDYRLGNRSALDWVIDQYQISTDKRSGITSDPNNPDDEEYIVRLVGQIVRVSIETVKIVNALPAKYGANW